ncbi:MAG: hypothetical protein KatS3mg028_0700 [Bacteroidia bacterium]|nr:MAG: hypothetical protein KatS3mg028_0700 [Bacteroidia bacterium]
MSNRFVLRAISSLFFVFIFSKCAQIVPLTGGQRDTKPPEIIHIYPDNFTKNFSQKQIVFTFDEKIQLINPGDKIIITPATSKKLKWNVKNKTLQIILPDSLQENTTYKIIFNKTIADLTERNTIDIFEYVFGTGNYIDSLYIKGNVKNQYTLNNENKVLIALYNENESDSAILKKYPLYFTKTDEQGNYILKNLPDKNFKVFAYKDDNNNFNYDPFKEKIDIVENPVNPSKDSIINFFVAEEKPSKNLIKRYYSPDSYHIHIIYSYPDTYQLLNPSQDIYLLNDSLLSDTCKILIRRTDTAYLILKNSTQTDTLKIPVNKRKKEKAQYSATNLYNNHQPFFQPLTLLANFWIDTSQLKNQIILYKNKDSAGIHKLKDIKIYPDKIIIYYPFEQNTSYVLKIPVKSMDLKDSSYIQKIEFKTNAAENYAQLKLNILFPDKNNYIVALCNAQHKIIYARYVDIPMYPHPISKP